MTGYYISVGYNSKYAKDEVWATLKREVEDLCQRPKLILEDVFACEGVYPSEDYADAYRTPWKDLTIFYEDTSPFLAEPRLSQYASGAGLERKYKEMMRRAFCRLILKRMHSKGMEININVV